MWWMGEPINPKSGKPSHLFCLLCTKRWYKDQIDGALAKYEKGKKKKDRRPDLKLME